jgi:hypothetical protein
MDTKVEFDEIGAAFNPNRTIMKTLLLVRHQPLARQDHRP